MKAGVLFAVSLFLLAQIAPRPLLGSRTDIICGETISKDTILEADLLCPEGTMFAIIIGASNITLDLGGYTIFGAEPDIGIYADSVGGITIRNGTVEGHKDAVFLTDTHDVTVEHLRVAQLTDPDMGNLIRGIVIYRSQRVTVRDSFFEYLPEFHREAVEVYESDVVVNDIEVHGGGAGVNFSYAESCDPVNRPSNGVVRNSRFSDLRHGVLVACSSSTWISGNVISPGLGYGVTADGPFPGAVTGMVLVGNTINGDYQGIQLGGTSGASVSHNVILGSYNGIALVPSLGCTTPETGWDCFYPTGNMIADNQAFGNTTDLYDDPNSQGNTWERNTCKTKEGDEIPECLPPLAVLTTNFPSGKPGSFFTVEGFNFPANDVVNITINNVPLGTIPTDVTGDLLFLLDTQSAGVGFYIVTASTADVSSSVRFFISSRNLIHEQQEVGPVFVVPSGTALGVVYLPFIFH